MYNIREVAQTLIQWFKLRARSLNTTPAVRAIADVTESDEQEVRKVLDECVSGQPMRLYRRQFDANIRRFSTTQAYRRIIGTEKYVGLMRMSLYCIVRLLKPDIVVETGVKWGEGSLFILNALERNGHGSLHSFDIGFEGSSESYWFPPEVERVGFFVPNNLTERWSLHIGDSLKEMPKVLTNVLPVDMFLHDSLHTYDHMYSEFDIALNFMNDGGILASEDIDANNAWEDVIEDHQDRVVTSKRFYAKQGIE